MNKRKAKRQQIPGTIPRRKPGGRSCRKPEENRAENAGEEKGRGEDGRGLTVPQLDEGPATAPAEPRTDGAALAGALAHAPG